MNVLQSGTVTVRWSVGWLLPKWADFVILEFAFRFSAKSCTNFEMKLWRESLRTGILLRRQACAVPSFPSCGLEPRCRWRVSKLRYKSPCKSQANRYSPGLAVELVTKISAVGSIAKSIVFALMHTALPNQQYLYYNNRYHHHYHHHEPLSFHNVYQHYYSNYDFTITTSTTIDNTIATIIAITVTINTTTITIAIITPSPSLLPLPPPSPFAIRSP
ncbi:hypothetical protein PoB_006843700 [Plakobranchus ocellatus]|uniref:Uncharacterized protein n=1 Tax=Plakobranchus ocellatus TaxID=259542 RepID=A0AAV4DD31_9GAST|nr:hypothetical protein PoB_006843700 [Plakobranchus ocellatus]